MSHADLNNGWPSCPKRSSSAAFPSFRTASERPALCLFASLSQHRRSSDVFTAKFALKSLSCAIAMSCRPRMLLYQEEKVDYSYLAWCQSSRSEKYFACSADSCTVFHYTNCIICISNFQMAQAAPPRVRPTTWSFVLRLQMPNSRFLDCRGSSRCVPLHFQRHSTSNLWIGRLLFFLRCAGRHFRTYSLIFALLQQGWFSDARIPPEITRWTPVWPGKYRDWRQNPQIQAISAAMQPHASLAKSSLDIWPNFLWTSPTVPP